MPHNGSERGARPGTALAHPQPAQDQTSSVGPFGPYLTTSTALALALVVTLAIVAVPALALFAAGALIGWTA